jgi:hypothetical protein
MNNVGLAAHPSVAPCPTVSPNYSPCPESAMLRADRGVSSCPDNGSAFGATEFRRAVEAAGRPTGGSRPGPPGLNGCIERLQLAILEDCWRPAFAARRGPGSRPGEGPQRISRLFQLRPRPHRAPHQRKSARRHSFRRPQDEDRGMSEERRYISGIGPTHLSHIGGRISTLGWVAPPRARTSKSRKRPG